MMVMIWAAWMRSSKSATAQMRRGLSSKEECSLPTGWEHSMESVCSPQTQTVLETVFVGLADGQLAAVRHDQHGFSVAAVDDFTRVVEVDDVAAMDAHEHVGGKAR